jgi:mannan endo-1,4-beta-mannosidase
MRARLPAAAAAAAALLAALTIAAVGTVPAHAQTGGFQTSGTQLLDANGNPFVARGTSLPHVWFTQNSPAQFNDVANLGANAVRVVLGSGHQWGPSLDVGNVIDWCKQNQMICVLEVHDATGFGEQSGAVSILDVVNDYWSNQTVRDAVQGEEAYVLVNIANEPRGNNDAGAWVQETQQAIQAMRNLGYDHTLVVDAPNWGQDWQFNMRDNAVAVANSDPQDNTLFSIHMYEVFSSPGNVTAYFDAFAQMNLPLMVGEFGWVHNGQNVAWQTVMSEAQSRGIGWYAWSWSGNSGGAEQLDQSNGFNPDSLTQWGQDVFNGTNGIAQTAQTASVYDGTPPPTTSPPPTTTSPPPTTTSPPPTTTSPPPTTTSPPPPPGGCAVNYQASDWGGHPGFTANVTVTNNGGSTINGWTLTWNYTAGQTVSEPGWGAFVSQSGATVTATNEAWNGTIPPGGSASFGFNGTATAIGNNPPPTGFTLNGAGCTT